MTVPFAASDFLAGKVAVVTGGGRGIGKMIAEGLVRCGARVYLSSRKEADLDATAEELSAFGEVRTVPADLGTVEGVETLTAALSAQEQQIHALINNAGANWGAPLEEYPLSAFDKVLSVNVKGVFALTRALLPLLRAASSPENPARVVTIGSVDGLRAPNPGYNNFAYSASKAAVHLLTQQLAGELAPEITVNAVAPGLFETKMTEVLLRDGHEAATQHIPMRRIGRPEDMAGIAAFLLGPSSTYITGAVITVDGGLTATR